VDGSDIPERKGTQGDRWAWNFGIQQGRPIAIRENRQWKPAVAYCRYADDFVVIVKGNKAHAETIREQCQMFLEGKLTLEYGENLYYTCQRWFRLSRTQNHSQAGKDRSHVSRGDNTP
jgi:hypothetical protein